MRTKHYILPQPRYYQKPKIKYMERVTHELDREALNGEEP